MLTTTVSLTQRHKSNFIRFAAVQIMMGLVSLVFESVVLATTEVPPEYTGKNYSALGTGIWCGIVFIISGISCLAAKTKHSLCVMIFTIVIGGIAIVFSIAMIWIQVLAIQTETSSALHVVLTLVPIISSLAAGLQIGFGLSVTCFISTSLSQRPVTMSSLKRAQTSSMGTEVFVSRFGSSIAPQHNGQQVTGHFQAVYAEEGDASRPFRLGSTMSNEHSLPVVQG